MCVKKHWVSQCKEGVDIKKKKKKMLTYIICFGFGDKNARLVEWLFFLKVNLNHILNWTCKVCN